MRSRYKPSDRRLLAALSLSLLIHGALLALRIAPPAVQPRSLGGDSPERLDVALAPPTAPR